ncbi:unnamed protein product [Prorocentrum cordatum]|uniref:Tudor domain-containing protein n=1 Tax=Prorocentrum cordatum TaxID=2364126 RepID=A0ABN9V8Y2_9DINO|nr:unnamed protein product [Polarella glacialis]
MGAEVQKVAPPGVIGGDFGEGPEKLSEVLADGPVSPRAPVALELSGVDLDMADAFRSCSTLLRARAATCLVTLCGSQAPAVSSAPRNRGDRSASGSQFYPRGARASPSARARPAVAGADRNGESDLKFGRRVEARREDSEDVNSDGGKDAASDDCADWLASYGARAHEFDQRAGHVKIHYDGFDNSSDEWLPKDSTRIVADFQVPGVGHGPQPMQAQPPGGTTLQAQLPMQQPQSKELAVGARLTVLSPSGVRQECTVVQVDLDQAKVHYEGFDSSHDEWLPMSSSRIVARQPTQQPAHGPQTRQGQQQAPGADLAVGAKVTVLSRTGMRRECTVVQANPDNLKVHYEGFDSSRDEWLPRTSNRIVNDQQQPAQPVQAQPPAGASPQGQQQPMQQPQSMELAAGAKLTVLSSSGVRRECTVVQGSSDLDQAKVHYEGFDSSHDEWLPMSSDRIVARQPPQQQPHQGPQALQGQQQPQQQQAPGADLAVGAKVTVLSQTGMRRECTVVQVHMDQVKVHYEGFDSSRDEWLPKTSNRIVNNQQQQSSQPVQAQPPAGGSPQGHQQPMQQSQSMELAVGTKLTVLSPSGVQRECAVVQVDLDQAKVHYEGFDSSRDEWLPMNSNRIVARQPPQQQPHQGPQALQGQQQPQQQQAPGADLAVGAKVTVLSQTGMRRECTVVQVHMDQVKVHYEGFDSSRDEWLPKTSNRIVNNQQQQSSQPVQAQPPAGGSPQGHQQPMQQSQSMELAVGTKLTVLSPSGVQRECTVVQVDLDQAKVHYEGFDSSRDEWLPMSSDRIVARQPRRSNSRTKVR